MELKFDILLNQLVLVVSPLMCVLADNPRASELLNHLGSTARKCCRMYMARYIVMVTSKMLHLKF